MTAARRRAPAPATVDDTTTGSAAPRALIVSLFGLYARDLGGWLSVATIVALMADLGVDEQATRSAVFRLKKRGWLEAEKDGRTAGYRATDEALAILAEGDERIYGRRRAADDEGWLLVVFSVPETERDKRHQLRTTLTRLGLGTIGPGTWVAPGHLATAVTGALDRAELRGFTDVFAARHLSTESTRETIGTWWDLDALEATYADYLHRFAGGVGGADTFGGVDGGPEDPADDRAAFAAYVPAITAWRRLPYLDPGLPLGSLPDDWIGLRAEAVFARYRDLLAAPAAAHVRQVVRG